MRSGTESTDDGDLSRVFACYTIPDLDEIRHDNYGSLCNGVPLLHDTLHKVNIKYEYYATTDIIFSQYLLTSNILWFRSNTLFIG